ncbi:hypothetical protein RN001_007270 [Aquatica leii]|uniref:Uncharacterized protein n=1 Tax=Aquatica leii TaxID=1421715 RepID=A0AAN7PW57_9COLE|nr:hypothetical protein RN001_007270 [Aquatica leii]
MSKYGRKWVLSNFNIHFKNHFKKDCQKAASSSVPHQTDLLSFVLKDFSNEVAENNVSRSEIASSSCLNESLDDMEPSFFLKRRTEDEAHGSALFKKMPQRTKEHSQISKWKDKSYSRQQRQLRKFEVYDERQPKITEYFNILKSMQECLQENRALRMEISREICPNMEESEKSEKQINKLLVMLQDTALRNFEKNKHGKRFSEPFFCLYFYIISGRLAYETLYRNMTSSLPSLSTIHRTLDEGGRVEEGAIRMSQLKQFLVQQNLPLKIFVCEDQTAVIQTIQYEPKINEMVGFVSPLNPETGFPERGRFIVNTLTDIERAFNEENVSKNAYVFMGQALHDRAPSFCICVYGSDNKFSAEDVLNRWQ